MNKAVLVEELDNVGINMTSFEFSEAGYVLELSLNPDRATGWEVLENLPIVGLELAKSRHTGAYTRKVLFVPGNGKEFKDYVIKHMRYFGLGREKALSDLKETVNKFGTKQIRLDFEEYLKRIRK
ncbi:MAG: hypothetical protein IJ272_10530 [Clostridia bacterium]|nr:hypothetical protein [Clostridia bacterium]